MVRLDEVPFQGFTHGVHSTSRAVAAPAIPSEDGTVPAGLHHPHGGSCAQVARTTTEAAERSEGPWYTASTLLPSGSIAYDA